MYDYTNTVKSFPLTPVKSPHCVPQFINKHKQFEFYGNKIQLK